MEYIDYSQYSKIKVELTEKNLEDYLSELSEEELEDFQMWMQRKLELNVGVPIACNSWKIRIEKVYLSITELTKSIDDVSCESVC